MFLKAIAPAATLLTLIGILLGSATSVVTAQAPDAPDTPEVAGEVAEQRWGSRGMPQINKLSDAFRYSPSSQFAPGDGGVNLDGVDGQDLEIVKVTTLANDGEGSLRWALEEKSGLRLVVFEVGGVIDLQWKRLRLVNPHGHVIIAGQTAPPPGIAIIREAFDIHAPNVIVQHIRVRPGADLDPDALGRWLYRHTAAVEVPGATPPSDR